jgi:hypothetical protein
VVVELTEGVVADTGGVDVTDGVVCGRAAKGGVAATC